MKEIDFNETLTNFNLQRAMHKQYTMFLKKSKKKYWKFSMKNTDIRKFFTDICADKTEYKFNEYFKFSNDITINKNLVNEIRVLASVYKQKELGNFQATIKTLPTLQNSNPQNRKI